MKKTSSPYFSALDGLRFICAFWVVISHIPIPSDVIPKAIAALMNVFFNGTLAVGAFFIISGLCIHSPYNSGKTMEVGRFYASRFVRIAVPMLLAILIAHAIPTAKEELDAVLWSLYCEIIYYALYPVLLVAFKKFGVSRILFCAAIASVALSVTPDEHKGYFWAYGTTGTVVLGLPLWIMGCLMAEILVSRSQRFEFMKTQAAVWCLRGGILLVAAATKRLHHLDLLGYKHSLLLASPLIFAWLYSELTQESRARALSALNRFGSASYTVYLIHKICIPIAAYFSLSLSTSIGWSMGMLLIGLVAYGFYILVEKPAHQISKSLGRSKALSTA